jgi:hypothetical protein
MRQTSLLAYDTIKQNNLLSKMQLTAYELLIRHGAATAKELARFAEENPGIIGRMDSDSLHKRMSELKRLGAVVESGVRDCRITGRQAIVWELSGKLPQRPEPRKSRVIWLTEDAIRRFSTKPLSFIKSIRFREDTKS